MTLVSRATWSRSAKTARIATIATVGAAALLGMSRPCQAQLTFTFMGAGDSDAVIMSTDGGQNWASAYAGRYQGQFTGSAGTVENAGIFCTDPLHEILPGESYAANADWSVTDSEGSLVNSYYSGGLCSAMGTSDYNPVWGSGSLSASARASEVAFLADNYLAATSANFSTGASGSMSLTDNMSAISVAIWDIIQDGGDGVNSGSLRIDTSGNANIGSLVSYYEQQASANSGYMSAANQWIQAPVASDGTHLQDFVTLSSSIRPAVAPAAVPEPGLLVTGASLAGMTGMGLLRGRRRERKSRQVSLKDQATQA